ncbi:MAG: tRNA (adenosine(37)-N6)-threonylcarbamoyltransferase complex transferase subunit TsaD [Desulfuromonadales bacterium]|nr:tRNA (adenosine(37)-N6)-threonylcarbamoyltransferase complex transferase subunit TsaD [Desulfuromonadales bacterium]
MLLLTLETSCDETSAAVVRDGRQVLSNIIASQVDLHAKYGGVVPELASRRHLETINPVIEEALSTAGVGLADLDGIAVTRGPGLVGALLVGLSFAKALAYGRGLPLIGVHHIEGHILAIQLEDTVAYPYLALAVSGGHTHLFRVDGIGQYRLLGRTVDDAAGEAFDKVAKMLGLGYPGGPIVDRLAAEGDPGDIRFPRPLLKKDTLNFSFSGVKTSVLNFLHNEPEPPTGERLSAVAAAFQDAVVDVLTQKAFRAARSEGLERIVVAGGVACNRGLRRRFQDLAGPEGVGVWFPSPVLCSDNAAMLAVAADEYLARGVQSGPGLNAISSWPLEDAGQGMG